MTDDTTAPTPSIAPAADPGDDGTKANVDTHSIWTIPNALAALRLFGSPLLVVLAGLQWPIIFFWWMLFLMATDWVDGKLAIMLKQRSTFGARLDSVADSLMYIGLLIGVVILKPDLIAEEWPWIAMAAVSYVLTLTVGYRKFGRLPSYHTRMAKTSWLLMSVAVVAIFWEFGVQWPLRLAMATVTLTNLETTIISLTTRRWQRDVPTIFHAWKRDAEESDDEQDS